MQELMALEKPYTLDSREVAEMVGKQHKHLLRDIGNYIGVMGKSTTLGENGVLSSEPKVGPSEFFIISSYEDSTGRKLPCYQVTRKGCEMIANKLTGEKGILFTAQYVDRFHAMETKLANPIPSLENLSPQLQLLIQLETQQAQQQRQLDNIGHKLDGIKDVIALNPNSWRTDSKALIVKMAQTLGGNEYIRDIHREIYELVDIRAKVQLGIRLTNLKQRMALEGCSKSEINKRGKLDVIASDPKLIEIYIAIVKELAIKYGVSLEDGGQNDGSS